jgi:hypothetical protein
MGDPFPYALCEGQWNSIKGPGRELIFLGGDRLLEWDPNSGAFRTWAYDNTYAQKDPLPSMIGQGQWNSIRQGHQLTYLFEERLLDFQPASGQFHVWQFDRNASGDPLPYATSEGTWQSIKQGHRFIYMDADQVLDWDENTGGFRLWQYDRGNKTDPFPSAPLAQGQWQSIKKGKELVYLSKNRMLEWEPATGNYKVWQVARSGNDVLPGSPLAQGTWNSIRTGHKLMRVAEDQVLDFEPETGRYHVWAVQV